MLAKFNNTYRQLPDNFYTKIHPVPVKNPKLICFNSSLATELNMNFQNLSDQEMADIFSGNKILEGSEPIALVYAGHQFGHFVSKLGDGRAILLGEVLDKNGNQRDIQLKGSGRTAYSRSGDGRAALGPMIREYIVSEAMHALNIKTTRSLAIVTTGEPVFRETTLPGAILTRVAESHIRIGTFEYFASQRDFRSLKILADYVINRHYPKAKEASNPYLNLLENVQRVQADLVADWMRVGFIHGVMNTDNMVVSGETIDYGPCAFMDEYHPNKVFSSIDYYGRYAFYNQASVCFWNLLQLGQSLAPLIDSNPTKAKTLICDTLNAFKEIYESKYLKIMAQKIGIIDPIDEDAILIEELLTIMQKEGADYTLTFRYLSYFPNCTLWPFNDLFIPSPMLKQWMEKWSFRLQRQPASAQEVSNLMFNVNPALIPRNHQLERVIKYAVEKNDFSKMHILMRLLSDPYHNEQENFIEYMRVPASEEKVLQTFCGT